MQRSLLDKVECHMAERRHAVKAKYIQRKFRLPYLATAVAVLMKLVKIGSVVRDPFHCGYYTHIHWMWKEWNKRR